MLSRLLFTSTILEWNKFDRKKQQSSTLLTFLNSLLKIGWPTSKPIDNIYITPMVNTNLDGE